MKTKLAIAVITSIVSMNALAEYMIKYPMDGVADINIKPSWVETNPQYSDWSNIGSPSNCKVQTPLENTIALGVSYEKTMSQCTQSQERTVTTQLIRPATGEIKPNGSKKEQRTINDYTYKVQSTGTLPQEECRYSQSGKTFYWYDISRSQGATDGIGSVLMWDSTVIKNTVNVGSGMRPTEFTVGTYKYKRSTYQSQSQYNSSLWYMFYQICRTPI